MSKCGSALRCHRAPPQVQDEQTRGGAKRLAGSTDITNEKQNGERRAFISGYKRAKARPGRLADPATDRSVYLRTPRLARGLSALYCGALSMIAGGELTESVNHAQD